ncbi:gluconokinase [Aquibacillus sp. 3ASR75-11]|uniref:Gluconokinase n=1 Tax=Terrihalobacillus insolitus TaxID=2950438 RepID=A0A9X3WQZ9_9BACI|nr:gluconokinase [Terrihalobacillus insolitus]MDC3412198.1 gluconokinase [Terrihalobacillus insolitus]MDC3423108.1 gluconokinase [Terrihalobacillus insolitus]
MPSYVIGLDIGTTSLKAVLFDYSGSVVLEQEKNYPLLYPHQGWVEQDPIEIENAAIYCLQALVSNRLIDKNDIKGIGISSAMHSLICTTNDGDPLSASITWADFRSEAQTERLRVNSPEMYEYTGTPIHPMEPLTKLMWMKENEWEPYKRADKFISIKEFIIKRWFGEEVVDYSVAAATGLFDIKKLDWNELALEKAGIDKTNLFQPVPPTYLLRGLTKAIATKIGISTTTPFVIGASDGPLANLGVGAIEPGETAITIGTSSAIRQFTDRPLLDEQQSVFTYRFDKNSWITGGPSNNGGNVLSWLQHVFSVYEGKMSFDEMNRLASSVKPGANKLLFLPYLNGERAPFWDSKAKGTYIGLSPTHRKGEMIRAAMEGVIFNVYQIGHALEKLENTQHKTLFANGGFARSTLWVEIVADMFGKTVQLPTSHQSSAWGAAWLALYSLQEVSSLKEIKNYIPMKEPVKPNMDNHQYYQEMFQIYKEIYFELKGSYAKLNALHD